MYLSFRICPPPPPPSIPYFPSQFQSSNPRRFFLKFCKPHVLDLADRIKSLPTSKNLEIINNKDVDFPSSTSEFNHILKNNEPIEAKKIFYQMIETGFVPNVADFTGLVNALCNKGRLHHAIEVFGMMTKVECEPNIYIYNCVLKGLCYVGRVEDAYKLLLKIKKSSLKPDMYTYTAVMNGFGKVGRSDEAMELLDEAIGAGLEPNVVAFNTLFNGYFKEGRPMDGVVLLKRMKDKGILPDYICYNTLLHGLLKWGRIRSAFGVYKEMESIGCGVDERLMNSLLRGLCRKSRLDKGILKYAYEVFDKMSEGACEVYPCAHELAIEAFCIGNKVDKAFVNLCDMVRRGCSLRLFTFENVIRVLCLEAKAESALSVLVLLCTEGGVPSKMTFNVLISALNKQRMVLDSAYVYSVALKRGVVPMNRPRGCSNRSGSRLSVQFKAPNVK